MSPAYAHMLAALYEQSGGRRGLPLPKPANLTASEPTTMPTGECRVCGHSSGLRLAEEEDNTMKPYKYIIDVNYGFSRQATGLPVATIAEASRAGSQYGTLADSVRVYRSTDRGRERGAQYGQANT